MKPHRKHFILLQSRATVPPLPPQIPTAINGIIIFMWTARMRGVQFLNAYFSEKPFPNEVSKLLFIAIMHLLISWMKHWYRVDFTFWMLSIPFKYRSLYSNVDPNIYGFLEEQRVRYRVENITSVLVCAVLLKDQNIDGWVRALLFRSTLLAENI